MEEVRSSFEEQMLQKMTGLNRFHTKDKIDLLNSLRERFGDEVIQIVEEVECRKAELEWQLIAKNNHDNSMEAFLRLFWEPLRAKGFEYTCEAAENGVQMRCTKCPAYEMAKELDAADWLYHHTCSIDQSIASGFNPCIGFRRTKTLMQGDDCCDHFYYMKE